MKRFVLVFVTLCVVLCNTIIICAWDDKDHDPCMRCVLFGGKDEYFKSLKQEPKEKDLIIALQYASFLCIDYFNGNVKGDIAVDKLKQLDVKGLPDDIRAPSSKGGINYSASSNDHRKYTHKGWRYRYKDDKANWELRRNILVNTVSAVFGESKNPEEGFDREQIESLAAFIYYVHVLGDQIDSDEFEEKPTAVPFIRMSGHGDLKSIVSEVLLYSSLLFRRQKRTTEYIKFRREIKEIKMECEELADVSNGMGGLSNPDNYEKYIDKEKEFLCILCNRIPRMLKHEKGFTNVFKYFQNAYIPNIEDFSDIALYSNKNGVL